MSGRCSCGARILLLLPRLVCSGIFCSFGRRLGVECEASYIRTRVGDVGCANGVGVQIAIGGFVETAKRLLAGCDVVGIIEREGRLRSYLNEKGYIVGFRWPWVARQRDATLRILGPSRDGWLGYLRSCGTVGVGCLVMALC